MKFSKTGQEKCDLLGDCLTEVITWAGLIVRIQSEIIVKSSYW